MVPRKFVGPCNKQDSCIYRRHKLPWCHKGCEAGSCPPTLRGVVPEASAGGEMPFGIDTGLCYLGAECIARSRMEASRSASVRGVL
jgi:hypothetical protein